MDNICLRVIAASLPKIRCVGSYSYGLHCRCSYGLYSSATTAALGAEEGRGEEEDRVKRNLSFSEEIGDKRNANLSGLFHVMPVVASQSSPHLSASSEYTEIFGFFQTFGLTMDGFSKILLSYPQILSLDLNKDIKDPIFLLESVIGKHLVAKSIVSWPSLLSISKEKGKFQDQISFLLKCGFKRNTKLMVKALSCVLKKNKEDLELILRIFINHGLSQNYAYKFLRTQPTIFLQDPVETTRKIGYLLHNLCFSNEDLVKYSSFMLYDLDSHLRPRYMMHQWITSKRIVRRNFKLDYIMSMSEKQFQCKFVECHADGPRVYKEYMENCGKK